MCASEQLESFLFKFLKSQEDLSVVRQSFEVSQLINNGCAIVIKAEIN